METFKLAPIAALAAQLERGPKRLRLRQLLNIEFLLSVVEPDKQYPYDFACHALTGYRPAAGDFASDRLLDGESLTSDLVTLAEQLSEDADMPVSAWPEPAYSVADLAERFDVSTKTIFRWRRRGLAGWRFRFPDRRKRMMFPDRGVRRFVAQHADLVARGSSFSQLTKQERERIVVLALELVDAGQRTVHAVARVVAAKSNRAVETVRVILKHYDEAHPGAGLFNRSLLQVEADDHRLPVWEAYVDGATVEALAQRFDKSVAWVYRTITEMRARELRARKTEYITSADFDAPDADQRILGVPPGVALRQELPASSRRVPAGLPPYLAQLFRIPLLTPEGERLLFRKMNYLKFKVERLQERIDPETVRAAELDRIEELLRQAADVKQEIVQANLRLVVGIAKRHMTPAHDLFEIISDGNVSLMRAVDKFDYTRGFKFSTYASWAIIRNFARSVPGERHQHDRYQTGWDDFLDTIASYRPEEVEAEEGVRLRGALDRMLATLDPRECSILRQRYGLDAQGEPQTLEQIGRQFGVSKERVRQLETRAMRKLRGDFQAEVQRLLGA